MEKVNCGLGKCIDDLGGGYHCECDEGAKFYVEACFPICSDDSVCKEFANTTKWKTFEYCNSRLGHCFDTGE